MMFELTMAELKTAFRIFDEDGEGFIRVERFRVRKVLDYHDINIINNIIRS